MMIITIYVFNLNIFGVFISLFFNYVMLSIIFSRKYKGILNGIESNKKKNSCLNLTMPFSCSNS